MNFRNLNSDLFEFSDAYKMNEVKYNWKKGADSASFAVGVADPTGFYLSGFKISSQDIILTTGNYSRLVLEIDLQRSAGFYISQIYIPCCMIVILSYVSFFLKTLNVRLTTCALALLLMVVGCLHISDIIPKTPYVKSIDLFTGTCMTFVFAAFIRE